MPVLFLCLAAQLFGEAPFLSGMELCSLSNPYLFLRDMDLSSLSNPCLLLRDMDLSSL